MDMPLLKLKQMLKNRYGKNLELRPMMDLAILNPNNEDSERESVIHGNDLYIPIIVQQQFLGTAVVPHGWELCEENRKSIAQLVRLVLEPKLYTEFLDRRESNLHSISTMSFSDENLTVFGDDEDAGRPESEIVPQKTFNTSLIHLEGQQKQLVKKVALQIHEFSARWAFVPFEDVAADIQTIQDLCNLGGMTLFVQSLETLSTYHQDLLATYIQTERQLDEPLIITNSQLSLTGLQLALTNGDLLNHLTQVHLEVDRAPLTSDVLREMLDLFFTRDEHQDLH